MNNSQSDRYKYHKFFFLSQRTFDNEKFFTVAGCISESIGDNYYFVPLKMNWKEGTDLDLYSVYGIVMDKNYENCQYVYYVVKLDSFNKIYSVKLLDGKYDDLDDIEIVDDKIVQAKQYMNRKITREQENAIEKFANKFKLEIQSY